MKAVGIGAFAMLLLAFADKQLYYGRHVDIALMMISEIGRAFGW